jgi:Holliday junction resolvasome RuvABC ATP-dependent DNA helicase subunit
MNDMAVSGVDSALSSAGVDKSEFDQEAQKAEQSQEIQSEIDKLSKDGLTEEEQTKIGGMVADKALEAMGVDKEGLSNDEKMALAEYCGKCLDGQATEAADEAMTEPAAT